MQKNNKKEMIMIDILVCIIVVCAIGFLGLLCVALCKMASESDLKLQNKFQTKYVEETEAFFGETWNDKIFVCPNCGKQVYNEQHNYCGWCGFKFGGDLQHDNSGDDDSRRRTDSV